MSENIIVGLLSLISVAIGAFIAIYNEKRKERKGHREVTQQTLIMIGYAKSQLTKLKDALMGDSGLLPGLEKSPYDPIIMPLVPMRDVDILADHVISSRYYTALNSSLNCLLNDKKNKLIRCIQLAGSSSEMIYKHIQSDMSTYDANHRERSKHYVSLYTRLKKELTIIISQNKNTEHANSVMANYAVYFSNRLLNSFKEIPAPIRIEDIHSKIEPHYPVFLKEASSGSFPGAIDYIIKDMNYAFEDMEFQSKHFSQIIRDHILSLDEKIQELQKAETELNSQRALFET